MRSKLSRLKDYNIISSITRLVSGTSLLAEEYNLVIDVEIFIIPIKISRASGPVTRRLLRR